MLNARISVRYTAPPSGLLGTAEEAAIMVASHVIHKALDLLRMSVLAA